MNRHFFRSSLSRALGHGAVNRGSRHWVAERVTAMALVRLTLWFAASFMAHVGGDYRDFVSWLRRPPAAAGMILLLIVLFYHTALGLRVVIEDYVHSRVRFAAVIAIRLCCYGLAAVGVVATLRIAFRG